MKEMMSFVFEMVNFVLKILEFFFLMCGIALMFAPFEFWNVLQPGFYDSRVLVAARSLAYFWLICRIWEFLRWILQIPSPVAPDRAHNTLGSGKR